MHSGLAHPAVHPTVHPIVTLVGSPNCGKTTLYNWLTGARHKTVNYPGATVEFSRGMTLPLYWERPLIAIDTPGTYSLIPKSPDEQVTYRALFEHPEYKSPHVIVAVVDATLLSRQLLIVRQLQEAGFQVVIALTMMDLLHEQGLDIDTLKARMLLGAPVIPVDGRLGGGVKELVLEVGELAKRERPEGCPLVPWDEEKMLSTFHEIDDVQRQIVRPRATHKPSKHNRTRETEDLDRVLLHPIWGLVIFTLLMGGLFTAIFWAAAPFMDLVDDLFTMASESVYAWAPGSLWVDFLANGIIKGLGAVLVFVPQIVILFLGLICLEDSGYLARAATLVDRPLSAIGLNGRSFVPLLSAYACAIPAMLSARTISSKRERWLTLFIIPLMTCSARLPVYALLLSFLFVGQPAWKAGFALAGLYFASLVMGSLASVIANRFLTVRDRSFFMLELPQYRTPQPRKVLHATFERTRSYLMRAGPTILFFSLIIWVATTFPHYELSDAGDRLQHSYAAQAGHVLEPIMSPMGADWRVGVGLLSAFAAREVFVSSLAIVFNATADTDEAVQSTLLENMKHATHADGTALFTPASVLALLVFFMIALQCMSTVTVAYKESGRWKFALLQLLLFNSIAYGLAVSLYKVLS